MRRVKSDDLVAMLDFLYFGEANVFQDNLESFLAIAEEFQLKGLIGNTNELKEENKKHVNPPLHHKQLEPRQRGSNNQLPFKEEGSDVFQKSENIVSISGDFKELGEKVNSMMEKSENSITRRYTCNLCGKTGMRNDIRKHIESNHLEGVAIPCNICESKFSSRRTFKEHNLKFHKKKFAFANNIH